MSLATKRIAGLGLLVAIALAIILGVTKPNPFAVEHSYWAVFDTTQGLGAIDRDVRIAGVKVGEIGDVDRTGDDVRVQLKLYADHQLHVDARAHMRPHTLFEGSNFVDLSPGSASAELLDEGATIPRAQTTNYVTLDEALRVLRPEIRNDLRDLAEVGARTLRGKAVEGLQETLRNAPAMTAALAPAARAAQGPNRRELVGAIRGLARTVDGLAVQRDQLVPLAQRVNRTFAALAVDGGAPLDAALARLPGTLQALNDGAPEVEAVLERLTVFASEVGTSAPRALSRALRATTPILTRAEPVLREGRPLVRGARLIARRLAKARGGLETMFDVLARPLDTFPGTLEALNAQTKLGASSGALQLVAGGFEAGAGAVASYQTPAQNPSAPGHQLRVNGRLDEDGLASLLASLGGGGLPVLRDGMTSAVPCATVARVSRRAVPAVRANGGCR